MTTSFVLRLLAEPPDGELHGEIEDVSSGERTVVRSAEDLLAYLQRAVGVRTMHERR